MRGKRLEGALACLSIAACCALAISFLSLSGADATGSDRSRDPRGGADRPQVPLPPLPKAKRLTPTEGFALELLSTQPPGNAVLSPDSVAAALAMAGTGARGTTATQIAKGLGLKGPSAFDSVGKLQEDLPTASLAVANGLFVQQGLQLQPPFVAGLERHFAATPEAVDFAGDPDGALRTINAWGSEHTGGVIPRMLSGLPAEARLVLADAVYLKARWKHDFEALSYSGPFKGADGRKQSAEFMYQLNGFHYGAGPGYKAVELPYRGSTLSLLAVLPVGSDLATLERRLQESGGLAAIVGGLSPHQVKLSLPRFHLHSEVDLEGPLTRLGMTAPFSDSADFSGITSAEALKIGAARHVADIKVDEKGTEAAATTGIVAIPTAGPAEPLHAVSFEADHPFLFFVRDDKSGAVLFAGRLTDPGAAAEPK
jgi:serpin B